MITTKTGAKKIEGTDNWREIFDAHNDSVDAHDKTQNDLDITIYGNKAYWNGSETAVTEGQFVSVRGSTISGITDGLYKAKDTVASGVSFVSANLEAVTAGGLNALNDNLTQLEEKTYRYYDEGEHLFPIPASGDASVKIPNFRVTEAYMILFSSGNASAWYYYGIYFSANQAPFIETIKAVGISVSANGDTLTFHNSNSGYPVWGKLKII